MHQAAIVRQLRDWHLLPEPQRLTELYFTDHTTLPKTLTADARQTATFTVHNLEHQPTTYHYKLIATAESGTEQVLGDGTFTLDHNDTHLGSADFVVPPFEPRMSIRVDLYYQGVKPGNNAQGIQTQSINYWVTVIKPTSRVAS